MKRLPRLLALLLIGAAAAGLAFAGSALAKNEKEAVIDAQTYEVLNLFGDVFERVRENYVEEVPDKKLIENALNGMLMALDPHSSYLDESNFADMKVQTKGEFGGLGIEVTMESGVVKVVSPIDETPAAKAGLQPGDLIIKLDGEEVMGLTLSDAVDRMRGKVGTPIILTIMRSSRSEPFEVTIVRDVIKVQSVRSRLQGEDVGYIRITSFNEQVEDRLDKAVKELKVKAGDKLKGLVLDMRNNPGGLLDQAIYVSDAFLEQGEIVSTRGRHEEETKRVNAAPGDIADGLPIVVLINEGSASASEIVAGALQDHNRAIVVGTKSFGKGSVQTVIALPGHGAMRLTTARYYTPSGRSIQAEGIVPDIEIKPAKLEELEDKLAKYIPKEADLRGALKNDNAKTEDKKNEKPKTRTEMENEADAKDYQLQRAVDLIRGISLYTANQSARK